MDSDSPFVAPKRRGRRKKATVASPEAVSDAALAQIERMRPTLDVGALRLAQEAAAKGYADNVSAERVPAGFDRAVLARIVSWYATPYEWREPKTEIDLAVELNITPLALRIRASMFRDGIDQAQAEIRRSAQGHARLRFYEAIEGQIDAAVAGSAPAFDRVKSEAWGDEIAPLIGGVNVTVNVAAIRAELLEKLG